MIVALPKTQHTVDDLLALGAEGKGVELVDGEFVEHEMSLLSSAVAAELTSVLQPHCKREKLGTVFANELIYRCFPWNERTGRKPDISFVAKDRLPADWMELGILTIAPDLAVGVISTHDIAYDVYTKIREYLDAGVKLVWEVVPHERLIMIHRVDGTVAKLKERDTVSGEDVLPGFTCRVGDLFPGGQANPPTF
jgi:Uma2 family endonuclease